MPRSRIPWTVPVALVLALHSGSALGQARPAVPAKYAKFFSRYVDDRSLGERMLNVAGMTTQDVGRSFALIAGVAYYPNMSVVDQRLDPAAEDVRKLRQYLEQYEFFDEIVVLDNQDVTTENLEFFLQSYFPTRLRQSPKSRFLFAYSGHGMTDQGESYLLKSTARGLTDRDNALNLRVLQIYMNEVVSAGHQVLVLLNSCYGGVFLKRAFGKALVPRSPGAHAIAAGGSKEPTWALPDVGSGSLFFEKVLAGLDGRADASDDGLITAHELATYLRREVQLSTDQRQNPEIGDISRDGSQGEFFFLDRRRQIERGLLKPWNPSRAVAFGEDAQRILMDAKTRYRSREYEAALNLFQSAARAGSGEAMLNLGYMYEMGLAGSASLAEAFRWYRAGAEAGDPSAMSNLGVFYRDGRGTERDLAAARRWFEEGTAKGNPLAMAQLAIMYRDGLGVPRNDQEALRLYRAAAELGGGRGMAGVGYMYKLGRGVLRDLKQAEVWYRKAVDAGEGWGAAELGYIYRNGDGVKADSVEAFRWFLKGAQLENSNAMMAIGYAYETGGGLPSADDVAAREWYRRAAVAGDVGGMNNYGSYLRDGRGGPADQVESFTWIRQSAEGGDPYGMANLGYAYERGLGVDASLEEAVAWYRRAAAGGHEWAANQLKRLGR